MKQLLNVLLMMQQLLNVSFNFANVAATVVNITVFSISNENLSCFVGVFVEKIIKILIFTKNYAFLIAQLAVLLLLSKKFTIVKCLKQAKHQIK